jgi:hypothetical protein
MFPGFADSKYPKDFECLQRVYPLYYASQGGGGEFAEPREQID